MADSLMRAPRILQKLVLKCSRMAQDMDRVWKLMCTGGHQVLEPHNTE